METILEHIRQVSAHERLVIFLELLLIGGFVYLILSFLEGTRGERLFRGVVFIFVAGLLILKLVVNRFGLVRVEYLYNGFLIAISILAVAAFQPEIRRALIRIGQTGLVFTSSQQLSRTVEEIVSAVMQLSKTKTGAIIVIEQQVGLGEFIETGVRLDAKVTDDLLKTIFHQGTALHDMAVIIQGDRIIAARVQLPLAEGETFQGKHLGSRHRAAVGVTMGSDAIVIVVSEETGIISVALNGNLMRNIIEDDLRRHLTAVVTEAIPMFKKRRQKHPPV